VATARAKFFHQLFFLSFAAQSSKKADIPRRHIDIRCGPQAGIPSALQRTVKWSQTPVFGSGWNTLSSMIRACAAQRKFPT